MGGSPVSSAEANPQDAWGRKLVTHVCSVMTRSGSTHTTASNSPEGHEIEREREYELFFSPASRYTLLRVLSAGAAAVRLRDAVLGASGQRRNAGFFLSAHWS